MDPGVPFVRLWCSYFPCAYLSKPVSNVIEEAMLNLSLSFSSMLPPFLPHRIYVNWLLAVVTIVYWCFYNCLCKVS